MELINSEDSDSRIESKTTTVRKTAPELPSKRPDDGQAWLRTVLTVLLAIVLVVLIVLFARWVYHKVHKTSVQTPTGISQASPKSPNNYPQNGQAPAGGSSDGSTTLSSPNTPNKTNTNSNVPNTGPGSTVAIFVSASLAAAGLHYIISLRRSSHA